MHGHSTEKVDTNNVAVSISQLKPRCAQIMQNLLNQSGPVATSDLARHFGLTSRSIRYHLDEIGAFCGQLGFCLVRTRTGVFLEGRDELKVALAQNFPGTVHNASEKRLARLLSVLLFVDEPVLVKQLEDSLGASQRTIYTDMDRAEDWLSGIGLKVIRRRHYGAKVEGTELLRRFGALRLLRAAGDPTGLHVKQFNNNPALYFEEVDDFLLNKLLDTQSIAVAERCLKRGRCQSPRSKVH